MDREIIQIAKQWASHPYFNNHDRQEIQDLIEQQKEQELTERFYKDLEFGTGGLRSIIGMGRNRINRYTIRKATQAMINAVKSESMATPLSFALSYDSRKFSYEFACEACGVLAANGIKAYIFPQLTPVPMLSFAVRKLEASAGIMITASHNPKAYNGFKAYWSHGGQVVPPVDQKIIEHYNQLQNWDDISFMSFEEGQEAGLIKWMPESISEAFYQTLEGAAIDRAMIAQNAAKAAFIYTPIHGTGLTPCQTIMQRLGFKNFYIVEEQAQADHTFPTVEFPNPEYPEALKMATDLMLAKGADVAFGSDPDTDRLGVAVREGERVHHLNGNQIALLMLDYILRRKKERKELTPQHYIIKSIVTSGLQEIMAQHYGVQCFNTLTGFKWMGALMSRLEKDDPQKASFLFANEESYGYMTHNQVRDKDGVGALAMMSEVVLYHKTKGKTLLQALDEIYQTHGFATEELLQFNFEGKEGAEKIQRIMDSFRSSPLEELFGEKVLRVDDLTRAETQKKTGLPSSNVLSVHFASGHTLWLRPSGTEPKIKFYLMIQIREGELSQKKAQAQEIIQKWTQLIEQRVESL